MFQLIYLAYSTHIKYDLFYDMMNVLNVKQMWNKYIINNQKDYSFRGIYFYNTTYNLKAIKTNYSQKVNWT